MNWVSGTVRRQGGPTGIVAVIQRSMGWGLTPGPPRWQRPGCPTLPGQPFSGVIMFLNFGGLPACTDLHLKQTNSPVGDPAPTSARTALPHASEWQAQRSRRQLCISPLGALRGARVHGRTVLQLPPHRCVFGCYMRPDIWPHSIAHINMHVLCSASTLRRDSYKHLASWKPRLSLPNGIRIVLLHMAVHFQPQLIL